MLDIKANYIIVQRLNKVHKPDDSYISKMTNVYTKPSIAFIYLFNYLFGVGRVVTLLPPTSEIRVLIPGPTSSWFTVQNLDQLYVLGSSTLPTTCRDMTCTVLKVT